MFFLGPGIREENRDPVELAFAEHESDALGVCAEKEEVIEPCFDGFLGAAKDGFKLPVEADIGAHRIPRRPLSDDVTCVASDLELE
jgi:hypothetical protein